MDDLDFSATPAAPAPKPATPVAAKPAAAAAASLYEPKIALEFFRLAGAEESFPAGRQIFAENEKSTGFFSKGDRIYLLLEGEVTLTLKGKPLEMVLPGEIFGEMAAIADLPRSATATARKNCRVLALEERQFVQSLQQMPEFALMLISVMTQRLRRGISRLAEAKRPLGPPRVQKNALEKKLLADLHQALGSPAPTRAAAGQTVVAQGAVGACMFVVTAGRVAITIDDAPIEFVETGGVFGEIALVDRAGRAATATAETDSAWILVSRADFIALLKTSPAFGIALLRAMSNRVQHIANLLKA